MATVFEGLQEIASQTHCDMELLTLIVKLHELKNVVPASRSAFPKHHSSAQDEEGEKGEALSGDASRKWWATEDSRDAAMRGGWGDVRGLLRHWDRMCDEWKKSVTDACKMLREHLRQTPRYSNGRHR